MTDDGRLHLRNIMMWQLQIKPKVEDRWIYLEVVTPHFRRNSSPMSHSSTPLSTNNNTCATFSLNFAFITATWTYYYTGITHSSQHPRIIYLNIAGRVTRPPWERNIWFAWFPLSIRFIGATPLSDRTELGQLYQLRRFQNLLTHVNLCFLHQSSPRRLLQTLGGWPKTASKKFSLKFSIKNKFAVVPLTSYLLLSRSSSLPAQYITQKFYKNQSGQLPKDTITTLISHT